MVIVKDLILMNKIKAIIWILVLVVVSAISWHFYKKSNQNNQHQKQATLVSVAPAVQKNVDLVLRAVGTVVPYQSVAVRSRVDSQLMEVKFQNGANVNKGDVLFKLDNRALQAQLDQASANWARDKAQLDNLQWQYTRNQKLGAQQLISQQILETSRTSYDAQKAMVAGDQSAINNLKVQLSYTTIAAPIDGRTGTINVTVGNNVKANDVSPLVVINQIKPVWVQMGFPQSDLADIHNAWSKGNVAAEAQRPDNASVKGKLDYIDNALDAATGTFAVRALFDNTDEALWPGMFVNVSLKVGVQKNALIIPEVAVQKGPDGDYVFVIEQNKASRRKVTVARIVESEAVIAQGLKPGEQVTIDGMMKLEDGADVEVAPR
jgi:multidrug efflux system membrane fusion protein